MNAKSTNLGRIQEIYDVVTQTRDQMKVIGMTKERFLDPESDADDLVAEGIMNRVFRVAEEAGRVDSETAVKHGFDSVGARGVRNRLAHAYGDVDREMIWQVIESDLDQLIQACKSYCAEMGISLENGGYPK